MDMTYIKSLLFWNVNATEKRLVAELSHQTGDQQQLQRNRTCCMSCLECEGLPREGEGGSTVERKKW